MNENWSELTLKEADVILIDCVHKTPKAQSEGIPYIGIPQLKEGHIDFEAHPRLINQEDFLEWTKKANPIHHDVILSRRTNPGVTAVVPANTKFALGQNLVIIRSIGSTVDPPYLRWLLRGPEWWGQISKFLNVGAVFDSLRCGDIPNFKLNIPPLPEQKAITHILGTLDDKIELNRQMNKTLEAMAQSLFKSWFVDFDPVLDNALAAGNPIPEALEKKAAKRKLVDDSKKLLHSNPELASLFPSKFEWSEELEKWVPEGWEVKSIGEISSVISKGTTPRKSDIEGLEETIPFIKVRDIDDNGDLSQDLGLIPYEVHKKQLKRSILEKDDLLFSIAGTIGRVAIVPTRLRNSNCNQAVAFIRLNHKVLHNKLVHQFLRSDMIQSEIHSKVVQAVQANTSLKNLSDLKVLIPNDKILTAFNSTMNGYYDRLSNNKEHSTTLTQLRDSLLPQLISGKVRVPIS